MQLKSVISAPIGLAAMLLATPTAHASDMTPAPLAGVVGQSRSVACYLGAGVSGAFERDGTAIPGLMDLKQGQGDWGIEPNGGCDLLFSWGVLGIEADYGFSGQKLTGTMLGATESLRASDSYHINGRLGAYTQPNHHTLLYVLGGYAGSSGDKTFSIATFNAPFSGPHGYDLGAGVETYLGMVGSAAVKGYIEYTHDFLNKESSTIATLPTTLDTQIDRVTLGVRIQF